MYAKIVKVKTHSPHTTWSDTKANKENYRFFEASYPRARYVALKKLEMVATELVSYLPHLQRMTSRMALNTY